MMSLPSIRSFLILFSTLLLLSTVPAAGDGSSLDLKGSVRVRAEQWDWFETPAADGEYLFLGSTLTLSAGQNLSGIAWNVELAAPILAGLPDDAIAPAPQGQLGLGATYYAVNGESSPASLFVRQGWVGLRGLGEGNTLRLGRFAFIEGTERKPADANMAWLKNQRVAQRLVGTFGFSHVGRSFDGVHFSRETDSDNVTFVAAAPTVGVFEVDGMSTISDVTFAYGAAARNLDREDLSITTFGCHWAQTFPTSSGLADLVLWGAWQTGDWGTQSHSATAYAIETGYRFTGIPSAPWLRVGYFSGSGDADPLDGDHETFFQILPTPRIYARLPAYNLMNNVDTFAQVFLEPGDRWSIRADYHRIELDEGADLWYSGGGAFNKSAFGYVGRPGFGRDGLMDVVDLSVAYSFSKRYAATLYVSRASGAEWIDVIYPQGNDASFYYLELEAKF
jgi:hypothetical protein